jgi:hypothetical protein
VYWVAQQVWYEGSIVRYNRRKQRHRVNYDDGDHEWMHIEEERNRVQLQQSDGSWVLYVLYRPAGYCLLFHLHFIFSLTHHTCGIELQDEWRKAEQARANEDFKRQAWGDAQQWRCLQDERVEGSTIMMISDTTGSMEKEKKNEIELKLRIICL